MNQSQASIKPLRQQVNRLTSELRNMSTNGGRRRRRRRNTVPRSTILPGGIKLVDTEVLPFETKPSTLQVLEFCPGKTTLVRLDNEANKFGRWSLVRVVFTYQPTASLGDSGSITYGILPGPKSATIKAESDIARLKPFNKHSLWKASSLTVGSNICIQKHLITAGTDADSVAFCLYLSTSKPDLGLMKVSYHLILNYPHP